MLKKIVIFGSDTSYGKIAFDFFSKFSDSYKIVGLTFSSDSSLFLKQLKATNSQFAMVSDEKICKEIELKLNTPNCFFFSKENSINFVKNSDADIYVFTESNTSTLKNILSIIYDQKDVVLMSVDLILFSGKILKYEAKLKGINLYSITLQNYSLNQFLKVRNIKELDKIILLTQNNKYTKEDVEEFKNQKKDFYRFKKCFYSFTKFNLVQQLYLINYLYDISPEKFDYFNQSKNIISLITEFSDGSNLINTTNNDIYPVLYYYFCKDKEGFKDKNSLISGDKINLSLSRLDLLKEPFIKLGVDFLKKGGSFPIVYFLAFEILTEKYWNNKIKYKDILKKLETLYNDKKYYVTKPDLKTIIALKKKLENNL
jgi:1-deoxy-D-xylulose 5-phosphate reductoisomerase